MPVWSAFCCWTRNDTTPRRPLRPGNADARAAYNHGLCSDPLTMMTIALRFVLAAGFSCITSACTASPSDLILNGVLRACTPRCTVNPAFVGNGAVQPTSDPLAPFRARLTQDLLSRTGFNEDPGATSAAQKLVRTVVELSVRWQRDPSTGSKMVVIEADALRPFLESVVAHPPSLRSASQRAETLIEGCDLGVAFQTLRQARAEFLRYRFASALAAELDGAPLPAPDDSPTRRFQDAIAALRAKVRVADANEARGAHDLTLKLKLAGPSAGCKLANIPVRWAVDDPDRFGAESATDRSGWASIDLRRLGAAARGKSALTVYADLDWPQVGGDHRGALYMTEVGAPNDDANACQTACRTGSPPSVITSCRPAWARRPTEAIRCLARAALAQGDIDLARATTGRLKRGSKNDLDRVMSGVVAVADGEFRRARKALLRKRAKRAAKRFPWFWAAVYRVRLHEGDHAGACRALQATIDTTPARSPQRAALLTRLRTRGCSSTAPDARATKVASPKKRATPRKVIHFWASWCPPCIHEMPRIARFLASREAAALKRQGYEFVIINTQDDRDDRRQFLQRQGLTKSFSRMIDDFDGKICAKYGSPDLPATLIVDADGRVLRSQTGELQWKNDIKTLLSEADP